MKMFQTRCGNHLLYSDLDACELRARRDDKNTGEKRVDMHDQQREQRNRIVLERLSDMQIALGLHPGEASIGMNVFLLLIKSPGGA